MTGPALIVSFSSFLSAQNQNELRNLIFEPVLIETSVIDEQLSVKETSFLPQAENSVTITEYFISKENFVSEQALVSEDEAITDYESNVRQLELQGGTYESALSQELFSIANIHQANGDHDQALEHLDRALHVNRINLGLFNLDQEPIIESKITSYVALGDLQAADLQQEYLFYLKRKAYGGRSVALLPALSQYAEWNIFAFDSRLVMSPNQTYAAEANEFTENSVSNSIGKEDFRTVRLMNAQNIYRTIIQILLSNYGTKDPRLPDFEKRLALTNYFFATSLGLNNSNSNIKNASLAASSSQGYYDMSRVSSNSMGYRHGREALERRLDYMLEMDGVSPLDWAKARVELGDWLLIFKKRIAALEIYKDAYDELKASGTSQDIIDELFSPDMPTKIPTFIDYRYTRGMQNIPEDLALDYQGYLDIRWRINRYGQTKDVKTIGRSMNITDPIENRLLRQIRNSTSFRPRFSADELLDQEYVEARFYYSY